jgi:hypothetical protein
MKMVVFCSNQDADFSIKEYEEGIPKLKDEDPYADERKKITELTPDSER